MSEQTKVAFDDLLSTITSKLDTLKEQYPLNGDQLPMSFGSKKDNKPHSNPRKSHKATNKYKSKGRAKRNQYTENDPVAKDTSQFKKSVHNFTNNTEKKQWYYQQFMQFYHQLPSHLQTKYDVPKMEANAAKAVNDESLDYGALLANITSNYKPERPSFKDHNFRKKHSYIRFNVSAPALKKRKLSETKEESVALQATEHVQKEEHLATDLLERENQRQSVWKYYDESASYHYSRYLYYASKIIQDHWDYVDREEKKGRIHKRQHIYMAEYNEAQLEQHLAILPPDKRIPEKYWYQRYRYFAKYDEGIKLDIESWYSVTPEQIAMNIAQRCKCNVIMDAMCGAGGNAIAFAQYCDFVIAIDIDAEKVKMAKHNAKIYGVQDKIQFIVADFFSIAESFMNCADSFIDVVFLSPPWGGEFYQQTRFDIRYLCTSENGRMDGEELFKIAQGIAPNVAYYLPKNTNYRQLQSLASKGEKCEITKNHLYGKVKSITAYYGNLCAKYKKKYKK